MDSGNWAEWFGSGGTVAAFFLAVRIYGRDASTRRRAQAAQVALYLSRRPPNESFPNGQSWYSVQNFSQEPIWDLIFFPKNQPRFHAQTLTSLPPGEPMGFGNEDATLMLQFRDNAGRWWIRRRDGRLRELKPASFYDLVMSGEADEDWDQLNLWQKNLFRYRLHRYSSPGDRTGLNRR